LYELFFVDRFHRHFWRAYRLDSLALCPRQQSFSAMVLQQYRIPRRSHDQPALHRVSLSDGHIVLHIVLHYNSLIHILFIQHH
jgi:hypothetical protein